MNKKVPEITESIEALKLLLRKAKKGMKSNASPHSIF